MSKSDVLNAPQLDQAAPPPVWPPPRPAPPANYVHVARADDEDTTIQFVWHGQVIRYEVFDGSTYVAPEHLPIMATEGFH